MDTGAKAIRALCSLLPPHTGLLFSGFGSPLLFLFCSLTSFLLFLSTDFTVCVFVFCLPLQWDFRVSSVTSFPSSLEFQFDARFFFLNLSASPLWRSYDPTAHDVP